MIVTDFLNLFGITPDKYPFLVLAILIIAGVIYIRFSIGTKLSKVKDNVSVLIAYLYNDPDARDSYDTLAGIYIRDAYLKEHPEITD